MPKKQLRTKVLHPIRITAEEERRYRKAAEEFGEGVAEFARRSMDLRIKQKKLLDGTWNA